MTKLTRLLRHEARQVAVLASLIFATVLCVLLLCVRIVYADSLAHIGLLWNLFLAWLPMLAALIVYNLRKRDATRAWALIVPCAFLWLLFFPNAPYILTDILRLQAHVGVPLWYDLILLIAFAWTGTFLGLVSLYLMHTLVRRAAGSAAGWVFTLGVLALTGFGVYLGRFPRWNSWDLLHHPRAVLTDTLQPFFQPGAFLPVLGVIGFIFMFQACVYLCFRQMLRLPHETI